MFLHGYLTVPVITLSALVRITSKFQQLVQIVCFTFCSMEQALRQVGRVLQFSENMVQSTQSIFHEIMNILLI